MDSYSPTNGKEPQFRNTRHKCEVVVERICGTPSVEEGKEVKRERLQS